MENRQIKLEIVDGCAHCTPKLEELQKVFENFEQGLLPKDVKLTLELNSDWIGRLCWHLNKVTVEERKLNGKEASKKMKGYELPLYRYQISNKYYILLSTELNKAEVGTIKNQSMVNDFLIWSGFKTVKTFHAKTPRKAYFKAKRWILKREG